jgi:hypothetical protein
MELDDKMIDKMTKQEGCQSLLTSLVKQCIEEFGCEATQDALDWFAGIIGRELAEEYARNHFHIKKEENVEKDAANF